MAIVQISRITNRKGLTENLPQLAGAELGWAIDERRLFIGNGTLEDGAPAIGNTEILTEFSDIFSISEIYTYKGAAAGYVVQTGPSPGSPVFVSPQSWFDSFALITDFGAVGDGVTDCTDAINRALYQLYCRESNPQIRRALFFPAGRYLVTDEIIIPPWARLYGEGANSSVIVLASGSGSAYCARYGDSLQQTGVNMGNNGATLPTNIEIASMGFECAETTDVFLIENANFSTFSDVSFAGPLVQIDLVTDVADISCIRFASTPSAISSNITFRRCEFTGTTYGIATGQSTKGCLVTESDFNTLHQGVVLTAGGPTGFRVAGNSFDSIYAQGIYIDASTQLNVSSHNMFYDVGNHFDGVTVPATAVISLLSANNLSIGDLFERSATYSTLYPRVDLDGTASIAYEGTDRIKQGRYSRATGLAVAIADNANNNALLTVDTTVTRNLVVQYTVIRATGATTTGVRTGTLTVVAGVNNIDPISGLTWHDNYTENQSTGFSFNIYQSSSLLNIGYSTTSSGYTGEFSYTITYLD